MVTFADAKRIADEIVSEIHPLSIVVVGSVACKEAGNDLDILIVCTKPGALEMLDCYL